MYATRSMQQCNRQEVKGCHTLRLGSQLPGCVLRRRQPLPSKVCLQGLCKKLQLLTCLAAAIQFALLAHRNYQYQGSQPKRL